MSLYLEMAGIALIAALAKVQHQDFPQVLIGFFEYASPVALLILIAGFTTRLIQLRKGGPAIAQMMGGELLPESPETLPEKTLRNVVQEIAIAASVPPPAIFVLRNETAINAFAAGEAGRDAILGVTDGAMKKLSRDELQAVIAHEFSHILNHDTRLNMRTVSVVYALSSVFLVGYGLLRTCVPGPNGKGAIRTPSVALPIFGAGLALIGLGLFGEFLGRLVRAAVTRQRETLADASAVQFTRNPQAVASALYKIAREGGALNHFRAEELSHFLFAEGGRIAWGRLHFLATHPPIRDRIRAVDPTFLAKQFAWKDDHPEDD